MGHEAVKLNYTDATVVAPATFVFIESRKKPRKIRDKAATYCLIVRAASSILGVRSSEELITGAANNLIDH